MSYNTALIIAIQKGNVDVLWALLSNPKLDVNHTGISSVFLNQVYKYKILIQFQMIFFKYNFTNNGFISFQN